MVNKLPIYIYLSLQKLQKLTECYQVFGQCFKKMTKCTKIVGQKFEKMTNHFSKVARFFEKTGDLTCSFDA